MRWNRCRYRSSRNATTSEASAHTRAVLMSSGILRRMQAMVDTEARASEKSAAGNPIDREAELERRAVLLRAIGFAATHIVAAKDWRTGIQELLDRLGEAVGVSRVTLFEVHLGPEGRLVESIRYDWAEPGLPK